MRRFPRYAWPAALAPLIVLLAACGGPAPTPTPPPVPTLPPEPGFVADPQHPGLFGIALTSAGEGWAAGDLAMLYHLSGGRWQPVKAPVGTNPLWRVSMASPSDGWAAGNLSVLHYDGTAWADVPVSTTQPLYGIAAVPGAEAWAVGQNGTLLHYTGGRWLVVDLSAPVTLNDVFMLTPQEGWIAGESGVILHDVAGNWVPMQTGTSVRLDGIAFRAADDGLAVGAAGTILHYTAETGWQPMISTTSDNLVAVAWVGPGEAWAAGSDGNEENGILLHYAGGRWAAWPDMGVLAGVPLAGLAWAGPGDGWAVGYRGTHLLHYRGGTWHDLAAP